MPTLAELQTQMAAAVLADDPAVISEIRGDGVAPQARVAIYRGNTLASLTAALADAFPVVQQLVGAAFFTVAAQAFVRADPPASACLADYGGAFPDFLANFEPARGLAYLPDVARFDWAVHRAFHARDAPALDPGRVAALDPAEHPRLRFLPHPACWLVASRFPVDRIWRAHQGDGDLAGIDMTQGAACRALVDRQEGAIRLLVLGDAEYVLLDALFAGKPLGEALSLAVQHEPTVDLAALLARHLQRGTFCDLAPAQD